LTAKIDERWAEDARLARAVSPVLAGWFVVAGFVVPALYLLWASLPWPLIHDAPIMHYIAWRIGEGAVPYRDLFDMNQPGVYMIHWAVLRAFGDGDAGWRLFDLAWLALGSLTIAALARPWGPIAASGAAALFTVYHLAQGAWNAGQRDFLLCPLLVGGALGVAGWIETAGKRSLALAGGGLLLGMAITVKPHAALFAALLGVAVVVVARGRRLRAARAAMTFGAMVAVAPAATLAWLAARGALRAWREVTFAYVVPLYSRLGWPAQWAFPRWRVWIFIAAAVALSIATAAWRRRLDARHGVAIVGVGYGAIHFFAQGKGWEYHLYPLAAFAAVLAFSEIERLLRERSPALGVVLAASLVTIAVVLTLKGAEAVDATWVWDKERLVRLLVGDLSSRMRAGDRVQVLDTTEGGVHALLRLRVVQPTRFLYDFQFFHDVDAPEIRKLRAEFLRELDAHRPRFIVVFERGWPSGTYERIERFPELASELTRAYAAVQSREGYVIFAKRDGS
jgi:hypothetical protein